MELAVGRIVWARCTKDDIYWPGKITSISNNTSDLWSSESFYNYQQQCHYFVQFFVTNQSAWVTDILPYWQYRDSMTNDSFMNYGLHSTMKPDFLNAINQADYANSNDLTVMSTQQQPSSLPTTGNNTNNDFLLMASPMVTSNTGYYQTPYQQPSTLSTNLMTQLPDTFPMDDIKPNQPATTNNDWYAQQGLLVESITPPLASQNDNQYENIFPSDNCQAINSMIIVTTQSYSTSSLISFLFTSLSNVFHSSVLHIDQLTNYQHPPTSTISYLICFDHFDLTIKQTLNTTILNNLNAHVNYYFLLINAPSHELLTHFYRKVMNKRSILVLHYHSNFDNEPLLLCSGNRRTYEMIRSSILKYLCSQVKYIESRTDEDEQLYSAYCISSIVQSTNILNHFVNEQIQQTLNKHFDMDFLTNNRNVIDELFPQVIVNQSSYLNNLLGLIHHSNEQILRNKSKQETIMNDLFQSGAIQTNTHPPICEYYARSVLHEK